MPDDAKQYRLIGPDGQEVLSAEPPPAHANIEGWPWMEADPQLQKALDFLEGQFKKK